MMALLLAAGLGERLRPITNHIPKCLVPIAGRPLLDFWIESLVTAGVSKILVNTHYHAEAVHSFIKQHQHKDKIEILFEQELLGTGGTLRNAGEAIKGENILIAHADNFCLAPMNDFINCFTTRPQLTEITMMTFRTETPTSCGIVEIDDNGVVQKFHEKALDPPGNLASGAVFVITNDTVQFVRKQSAACLDFSREIIPHYLGRINTWENKIYHRDIGTPASYLQCLKDWEKLQHEAI
tara:strand:+ start:1176 stop:1892 length:717 start_codon:yes stop_codon:yes gene_type:complete